MKNFTTDCKRDEPSKHQSESLPGNVTRSAKPISRPTSQLIQLQSSNQHMKTHHTDRETAQWELSKTFITKFENIFKTFSKLQDNFPISSYGSFYMHTIWTLQFEVIFYFQHPLFGPLIFLWISLLQLICWQLWRSQTFQAPTPTLPQTCETW